MVKFEMVLTEEQMQALVNEFDLPTGTNCIEDIDSFQWAEMIDDLIGTLG